MFKETVEQFYCMQDTSIRLSVNSKVGFMCGSVLQERKKKCRGVMKVRSNNIVESQPYQCPPNFAKNELEKRIQECKRILASSNLPSVTQTYNKIVSELKDSGMDLIEKLPPLKNIKSSLYRWRNKSAGVSKMRYKNVKEIQLPHKFNFF